MGAKRWRIQGFDSSKLLIQETIDYEAFTEAEIIALLQRLAAKSLSEHEILNASRRKGDVGYLPFLEPRVDRKWLLDGYAEVEPLPCTDPGVYRQ
jgi:hypothetical protein